MGAITISASAQRAVGRGDSGAALQPKEKALQGTPFQLCDLFCQNDNPRDFLAGPYQVSRFLPLLFPPLIVA
ncbi:MAG: hypothetical protein DRP71_07320 [Verrucomicrobia bacterium]|nr:MAG: hypothetical protein DRP71_07320 [Verrucomicrobiota bacterium]